MIIRGHTTYLAHVGPCVTWEEIRTCRRGCPVLVSVCLSVSVFILSICECSSRLKPFWQIECLLRRFSLSYRLTVSVGLPFSLKDPCPPALFLMSLSAGLLFITQQNYLEGREEGYLHDWVIVCAPGQRNQKNVPWSLVGIRMSAHALLHVSLCCGRALSLQ